MRLTIPIVLLILAVCLAGQPLARADDSTEKVLLRNQFKEGETVYLTLKATSKGTIQTAKNGASPSTIPIDDALDTAASFKTLSINETGWATIQVKLERLLMTSASLGGKSHDLLKRLGLGEESASFEIDPVGKMKTVSLSDELGSALKNTVRSTTRQSPYLTLPSEAVALGFIWKERKQVPMVGATRPIVSDSTYTLERIEERDGEKIAVIQSETTIGVKSLPIDSSSPTQEGHSVVIRYLLKEYKTHGTGTIEFNIDRGQIVHFKTVQQAIRHNVGSTEINKASFEGDVIQKFTQTNEGTYSTTPPTESSDEASSEK